MRDDVKIFEKSGLKCHCYCHSPVPKGISTIPTVIERPFVRVRIDIISPLPSSSNGNIFIVVLVDYFTKWVEASQFSNIESNDIIFLYNRSFQVTVFLKL